MENVCTYVMSALGLKTAELSSSYDWDYDSKAQKLKIFTLWPFKIKSADPCPRDCVILSSFCLIPSLILTISWWPCFLLHLENWSNQNERFHKLPSLHLPPASAPHFLIFPVIRDELPKQANLSTYIVDPKLFLYSRTLLRQFSPLHPYTSIFHPLKEHSYLHTNVYVFSWPHFSASYCFISLIILEAFTVSNFSLLYWNWSSQSHHNFCNANSSGEFSVLTVLDLALPLSWNSVFLVFLWSPFLVLSLFLDLLMSLGSVFGFLFFCLNLHPWRFHLLSGVLITIYKLTTPKCITTSLFSELLDPRDTVTQYEHPCQTAFPKHFGWGSLHSSSYLALQLLLWTAITFSLTRCSVIVSLTIPQIHRHSPHPSLPQGLCSWL